MMLGEGCSHAWVEVWNDRKWIGFDPTNRKPVNDEYIKISTGRDSEDCLVNQGIFTGNVTQTQEISVLVEEVLDGTDKRDD
jgi:transglutaminase-like putative cysteine protease